jgi:DMSO reductase family type II enzyme chaperone
MQRRVIASRMWPDSAAPRCAAYASCSDLLTSPQEFDARAGLAERHHSLLTLQYAAPVTALASAYAALDHATLAAEYSGLFEVGDDGPPVPIRESLRESRATSAREEVVRFYALFGGDVATDHAWQPDHAAIELEFMQLLCYREWQAGSATDALPYQLAQLDFAARHPGTWLPALTQDVLAASPNGVYARIVGGVASFVAADLAWQRATVIDDAETAKAPRPTL